MDLWNNSSLAEFKPRSGAHADARGRGRLRRALARNGWLAPRPRPGGWLGMMAGWTLLAVGLAAAPELRAAATNAFTLPPRPNVRTNPPSRAVLTPRTNLAAPKPSRPGGVGTNAALAGKAGQAQPPGPGIRELWQRLQSNPAFYPAAIGLCGCLAALFLVRALRSGKGKKPAGFQAGPISARGAMKGADKGKMARACNVLELGPAARQLWQFEVRGNRYVMSREQTCVEGEPLPAGAVSKDWRSLFQPKLNIAWLPPENVFLKVAHLPRSDFKETLAMVELQLERLSPMPVAQIVWNILTFSHADEHLQTVVVVMISRSVVEEFLGRLEGQGYLADRLEVPLLDQLHTTAITEDGVWIYPSSSNKNSALAAWWYGGVLQSLDLLVLPAAEGAASLREQLSQMAWAGEIAGWLTSPPRWHLVADVAAPEWEAALRSGLDQPVETTTPRPARELAALTAHRSALSDPRANLLPLEFAARYQQQFVDRLWMRGLLGVAALYLLGVGVYMVALGYATYRTSSVEAEVAMLGPTYTNAIQMRDRYKVLKERQELKFAGLDCWNTTARWLPEIATLGSMNFTEGKRLSLSGIAPSDQIKALYDFERDMRRAITAGGEPLFDSTRGDSLQFHNQGANASWGLNLELKRTEAR